MPNDVNYKIGEILEGENNSTDDGNHYIIFFEPWTGGDFVGAMISTSPFKGVNIPMSASHFEIGGWDVTYFNSHLIPTKLIKFNEMGDFVKKGQLTEEGIEFMKVQIGDTTPVSWDEAKRQFFYSEQNNKRRAK